MARRVPIPALYLRICFVILPHSVQPHLRLYTLRFAFHTHAPHQYSVTALCICAAIYTPDSHLHPRIRLLRAFDLCMIVRRTLYPIFECNAPLLRHVWHSHVVLLPYGHPPTYPIMYIPRNCTSVVCAEVVHSTPAPTTVTGRLCTTAYNPARSKDVGSDSPSKATVTACCTGTGTSHASPSASSASSAANVYSRTSTLAHGSCVL